MFLDHKTQVQASTTLSFLEILSKIPEIGARGLYKGSIPAVVGQFARFHLLCFALGFLVISIIMISSLVSTFFSHGLRTSIYEASKLALPLVAPTLLDIQVSY